MQELLSHEIIEPLLVFGPGVLVALIILAVASKGLRGSAGAALGAFFLSICAVIALTAAIIFGLIEFYLPGAIANCEALEQAAWERGELGIFDCEDEGLIVAFPVFAAGGALIIILVGSLLIRLTRRRSS